MSSFGETGLDVDAMIDALAERPGDTVILSDFDGSLSPIVDRPEDALVLPAAIDGLRRLVGRIGRVGIVSGRPIDFLVEQLNVPGLVYAGLYGMEVLVDGERRVDPRVLAFADAIAATADEADARLPGVIVERKSGLSVTLHWRTAPEKAEEVVAVAAELAQRHGLAELPTRAAVELRPPIAIDKGTAVDTLIGGFAVGAFAGDDTGDLPAFAALARAAADGRLDRAVCIGVQSDEMPATLPAAVNGLVDGPVGLVALLDAVARRVR
jgi:trehalose 6-phosphate phosphatase